MRDDRQRLLGVQEAIEQIEKYTDQGRDAFDQNELIQTWVIHYLQIIGEACRAISQPFKDQYPEISWNNIIGMRNILVHLYFGIDEEIVWSVVERDLPALKRQIKTILQQLGNE
jgi:uncharacterized protein with HEPN domain